MVAEIHKVFPHSLKLPGPDEFSGPMMTNRCVSIHVSPVAGRVFRSAESTLPGGVQSVCEPRPRYGTVAVDPSRAPRSHGEDRAVGALNTMHVASRRALESQTILLQDCVAIL